MAYAAKQYLIEPVAMNIWYINPYNPIPGEAWRESRSYMACEMLSQAGHQVIWWTGNFSHHFKKFRSKGWEDRRINDHFIIRLVPTVAYRKNTSARRLLFEMTFAYQVRRRARTEPPPRCIICPDTILPVSVLAESLKYQFNAWLVLDVYDLWPELFAILLPKPLRPLAPIVYSPFYIVKRHIYRRADAITALCKHYLEVALAREPRLNNVPHAVIFNGIDVSKFRSLGPSPSEIAALAEKMGKGAGEIWGIYAGSLGNNYDIPTLLQAAKLLGEEDLEPRVKILVVGDGPFRSHVVSFIKTYQVSNIVYLGVLKHEDLVRLYQICDFGFCLYGPESNVAMPDKVYDYMAAGLPIINSLCGELRSLLQERQIGIQYVAGNPASLVSAIKRMASNAEERQMMARNSLNAAIWFDKSVQYRKFVDLIEQLVNGH